ncbi:MAG: hypothetical protein IJW36_00650 [Clostridia bacterium]|nr:hypothetical protein [Clostridia bacterium]
MPKSAVLKVAMPRYDTKPRGVGDLYVEDLKRAYYTCNEKDKIDLKELVLLAKNCTV